MNRISYGLFSVMATLGSVPVIRAPRGGPSEMVARQLNDLVGQAVSGSGGASSFFESGSGVATRPLVVVLDRSLDFVTALNHSCTYQALVDDVLDYSMNRVHIVDDAAGAGAKGKKMKTYDLEVETDSFWKGQAHRMFPEAVEANRAELDACLERETEIKNRTTTDAGAEAASSKGAAEAADAGGGTSELLATVDSLPKLLEVIT